MVFSHVVHSEHLNSTNGPLTDVEDKFHSYQTLKQISTSEKLSAE